MQQQVAFRLAQNDVEHDDRQHGADRVDHNAFPAQQARHVLRGPHGAQHGRNHRGARDHHDRAKQNGQWQGQIQQPVGGQREQPPGDQHAQAQQAPEHAAGVAQFVKAQRQAALEQDDGNGERHDGKQQVAEQRLGIEHAEDRAGRDARGQQVDDRRHAGAPGQPLADQREQADQGQHCAVGKRKFGHYAPGCASGACSLILSAAAARHPVLASGDLVTGRFYEGVQSVYGGAGACFGTARVPGAGG